MRSFTYIFIIIGLLTSIRSSADDEAWSEWRSTEIERLSELSNSTISAIFRDQDGDIYIATAEAIYTFDGEVLRRLYTTWATNNGYPLDRVIGFSSSSDESIWAYTVRDGVYIKTPRSNEFRLLADAKGWRVGDEVTAAIEVAEPHGVVNVAKGQAFFVEFASKNSSRIERSPGEANVVAIGTTPDGRVTIFDSNGWLAFYTWSNSGGWRAYDRTHCSFKDQPTGKLATLDGSRFYGLSSSRQLIVFDTDNAQCRKTRPNKHLNAQLDETLIREVRSLPESGNLTFATDKGLFIFKDGVTNHLNTDNSLLQSNQITAIAEISNDGLIVGSYLGLIGAHKDNLILINRFGNESRPEITSISSAPKKIFISTYRALYQISERSSNFVASEIQLPDLDGGLSTIKAIGKTLFVGTTNGNIVALSTETLDLRCTAATGDLSPITGFAAGSKSLITQFSSLSGNIYTIEECGDSKPAAIRKAAALRAPIIGLAMLSDDLVLINFDGIYSASELVHREFDQDTFSLGNLSAIKGGAWLLEDTDSGLVAASPKGSIWFQSSHYSNQSVLRSVPDTPYSIESDELGRVWLASKKGLWVGSDVNEFRLVFRNQEINAIAFEFNASHKTHEGSLIFGGSGGVVIIPSPSGLPQTKLGRLWLKSASVGRRIFSLPHSYDDFEVLLSRATNSLSFQFKSTFAIGRAYDRIETTLSPVDAEWTQHQSLGPVTVGPLPPGTYTFRARGANALGVWSENEISIPIRVLPPAWRSWWAMCCYLIAAILLFFLLKRFYVQRLFRQAQLAHGEEAARSYSRLEDDWQEQREATEHLLRSIPMTVSNTIQTMRTVVASQDALAQSSGLTDSVSTALAAIDNRLLALRQQQELCVFSTASQTCDAQQLVDELTSLVVGRARYGSRYIVLNETPELALSARQGQSIAIIVNEFLELMVSREPAPGVADPIVHICIERSAGELRILVGDREALEPLETQVDETLASTLTLLESLGGSITEKNEFGYEIEVKLPELAADK